MPGGCEHKAVDYFHNCDVLPITTVFFCAEWQHDCRALFSFTIFASPGPIRAIISQQKHCLLSSGPVCQASYSSLFILYEAFHVKSFWPYWNSPTRRVACVFISQADVDEKSAKLKIGWPIFQSNHDLLSLEYYCWFDTTHSFHVQLFHFTLHFQLLYC